MASRPEREYVYKPIKNNIEGLFVPLENPLVPGTPDVLYLVEHVTGLLELKYFDHNPVRKPSTLGVSDKQALFAARWCEHLGLYYLVVRFHRNDEWLIVNGQRLLVDGRARCSTWCEWQKISTILSKGFPSIDDFTEILTHDHNF